MGSQSSQQQTEEAPRTASHVRVLGRSHKKLSYTKLFFFFEIYSLHNGFVGGGYTLSQHVHRGPQLKDHQTSHVLSKGKKPRLESR